MWLKIVAGLFSCVFAFNVINAYSDTYHPKCDRQECGRYDVTGDHGGSDYKWSLGILETDMLFVACTNSSFKHVSNVVFKGSDKIDIYFWAQYDGSDAKYTVTNGDYLSSHTYHIEKIKCTD